MKRTAKINNWFVAPVNDEPNRFVLRGNVEQHNNPNLAQDGLHTTSPLRQIDFEKGIAVSQNTEYTLGTALPVAPIADRQQGEQVQAD